jgi:hypothetical protein
MHIIISFVFNCSDLHTLQHTSPTAWWSCSPSTTSFQMSQIEHVFDITVEAQYNSYFKDKFIMVENLLKNEVNKYIYKCTSEVVFRKCCMNTIKHQKMESYKK